MAAWKKSKMLFLWLSWATKTAISAINEVLLLLVLYGVAWIQYICPCWYNRFSIKHVHDVSIFYARQRQLKETGAWTTMMTSSTENIFRVTGALWEETTGHRWIPLTKVSDADLWCFHWSAPEQMADQTNEPPVIRDAIELVKTSL